MARTPAPPRPLPTAAEILAFVRDSQVPVGRREIARAFDIRGDGRIALKQLLRDMAARGDLDLGPRRKLSEPGQLPSVLPLEVTGVDDDGLALAAPLGWSEESAPPTIQLTSQNNRVSAVGLGDRVLARLTRLGPALYEGHVMRRLERSPQQVIGVLRLVDNGARLLPTDRRARAEYEIDKNDRKGAEDGELVVADVLPGTRFGLKKARVTERFAALDDPRAISLLSLRENDIPDRFPDDVRAAAEAAAPVTLGQRTDLRDLSLVTIDGADARDFDDAVWAAADRDPANPGGWVILVAIADVAHYVRPNSALDREARKRGNSVYFPDRVVPMLPEALSNGLCSLRPREERACLAVEMVIDAAGTKRRHRFLRGLMRSAARLTYEQAQAAFDDGGSLAGDAALAPALLGAYRALRAARARRGALEIEMPERRVVIGETGDIEAIGVRARFDSHRLIEEFMILANVAAAETLEQRRQPCMYRVHDQPDPDKLDDLRDFLDGLDLRLARGQVIKPGLFNTILAKAADTPHAPMVNELVLRSQAQAVYSPDNIGHFGLGLVKYAHFTSPIRRYADLLVHRALIAGLGLGAGGHSDVDLADFAACGAHISMTERRAAAAERSANDRFIARFLADRVGAAVTGRVSGVTRFGLFVTLDDTGADGLIPIGTLPDDYYDHDETRHELVGRTLGWCFRLGARIEAELSAVDPAIGRLTLRLVSGGVRPASRPPSARGRGPGRGGGKGKTRGKSRRR